jgi:hypothetical protein
MTVSSLMNMEAVGYILRKVSNHVRNYTEYHFMRPKLLITQFTKNISCLPKI